MEKKKKEGKKLKTKEAPVLQIDILGYPWKLSFCSALDDIGALGMCVANDNKILIGKQKIEDKDKEFITEKTLLNSALVTARHEIVHAYLTSSGLSASLVTEESWASNEEMVEWIAYHLPKIHETCKHAEAFILEHKDEICIKQVS